MAGEEIEKKLALALITSNDHNGAYNQWEKSLEKEFLDFPGHELYNSRVFNLKEIQENIRDHGDTRTIDTLILAFHGWPDMIPINKEERIDSLNSSEIFQDYKRYLSSDAIVLLYCCSTGGEVRNGKNVAESISDALDADVMAPKYQVDSECELPLSQKRGLFRLDQEGKIIFAHEKFVLLEDPIARIRRGTPRIIVPKSRDEKIKQQCKKYPGIQIKDAKEAFLYIDK